VSIELDAARALAAIAIGLAALLVLLPGGYLALLAVLSLRAPAGAGPAQAHRFAVLVPAHNEEGTIDGLFAALAAQDYPRHLLSVHVVADNCTDQTAHIAAAHGAHVHERFEPTRRGKGAALNWLIELVRENVDAVVFLDADSRPIPAFLSALSGELARGAGVIQGLYLVENSGDRPLTTLRALSFRLRCELRPAAYAVLGVSAGLYGNGMCFRRDLVRPSMWDEASIVEDVTLHLRLVTDGGRVVFAPRAKLYALMPDELRQAVGQATRWERGKVDLLRAAARLAAVSLQRRDLTGLIAAIEVLLPPTALVTAIGLIAFAAGALAGVPLLIATAAFGLLGLGVYVWRGLAIAEIAPHRLLRAIAFLPAFTIWHVWVILRVAFGAGRGDWKRSSRAAAGVTQTTEA
jgi:cellulose synthase/poly-beta-1,6-N-acetylglucosamine synthase-like glycosyltransferase